MSIIPRTCESATRRPEICTRQESTTVPDFCRRKNTPERKDYIMDKLVVPVEE
jgi:hypothetical protein